MSLSGASVILYPDVLRMAAKKLGGDLLVLPSSIHEVIIMRWENGAEDVLLDSVCFYCRKDDSFCRVTGNDGKEEGCIEYHAM